jgi:pseudouridine-5'-phosphate glycosidase
MNPTVALESTVIAHGLPYPRNLETARNLEALIREAGAKPKTIGIIGGHCNAGLSEDQLLHLATAPDVLKVSRRNLPVAVARGLDGATTVAATMWIAHRHGIRVFATGGIGGVHRGARPGTGSIDVRADLEELAQTPVAVVCAGPKAILDLPATREVLETRGVTVVGYGTDEMPAFYYRNSGLPVDIRCDTPEEAAAIVGARRRLGLPGAVLIAVPIPPEDALNRADIEPAIEQAHAEAGARGLHSAEVTPFLLSRIAALTGRRALEANIALLRNNARVAAAIAVALAHQEHPS